MIKRAPLLAATLALQGCAAVSTAGGEELALRSPEFRAYVERVFREQNQVADELAFALEAAPARAEPAAADAGRDARGRATQARAGMPDVEQRREQLPEAVAEQALIAACAGVNELATSRRDGQRLGLKKQMAAARSVPDCERATQSAVALLSRP